MAEVRGQAEMSAGGENPLPDTSEALDDGASKIRCGEVRAATAWVEDDGTLTWMPAWRLRELIGKRELSPVEVTNHFLARIEQLDPVLHAFRTIDAAGARDQAKRAETAMMSGEPLGPLHGIPVALKEHIAIEGLQALTIATNAMAPAIRDSIEAERLRRAGAILVGSTVLGDGSLPGQETSSKTSRPRNPWDIAHVPGISSSGSAAAVAAGMLPLAIASDGLGSIRLPAAFCGLIGMQPTRGRIPQVDFRTLVPFVTTVSGPLTRDVRDAALALNTLAGPDGRDFVCLQTDPPDYLAALDSGVDGLRLGWTDDFGGGAAQRAHEAARVIETVRAAALALTRAGASVERLEDTWDDTLAQQLAAMVHDTGLHADRPPAGIDDFVQALDSRRRCWEQFRDVFGRYDLLLSPTAQCVAPTLAAWETFFDIGAYTAGTRMSNWLGLPAASVPAGFVEGMPVGLHIMGPPDSETRILQLAHAFLRLGERS
jgi:Asp-tRNA(Asn)/Glu-tRNA(Gln) amidotransferase A subunit family amidase